MSLEEMGMQILNKNLENLKFKKSFDPELIFKILSDGNIDNAFEIIMKKQSTLKEQGDWWK